MAKGGGLAGKTMSGTFDMLRANDLIFNYVVSNWLLGQTPRPSTSWPGIPTALGCRPLMHAFYLRNFYVENRLAQDQLDTWGQADQAR